MSSRIVPTVSNITRHNGLAGQIAYSARVDYGPDAGGAKTTTFVGSIYGTSVVMVTHDGQQVQVTEPARFGPFGHEWVRRFFA